MTSTVTRRLLAGAVLLVVLAACGCSGSSKSTFKPPDQAGYRPLTTPAAPLVDLEMCYEKHDASANDVYRTLFDPLLFNYPCQGGRTVTDSTADPPTMEFRDYTAETQSFAALVSDPAVTRVQITFLANPADTLNPSPCALACDPRSFLRFADRPVQLTITRGGRDSVVTGTWDIVVSAEDTLNGVPQWRIIRWWDKRPWVPPAFRPPTTPVAPLANFGLCYRRRDQAAVDEYGTLLDTSFRFNFTDVSQDPRGIGYYTRDQEIAATTGLLTDAGLGNFGLTFLANAADTTAIASSAGGDTLTFEINGVGLGYQDGATYYTAQGKALFTVARFAAGGGFEWRIIAWNDETVPGTMSDSFVQTTWGALKAGYLPASIARLAPRSRRPHRME